MTSPLSGTVAVLIEGLDTADLARRLVAEGATVVLTGPGGEEVGRLLMELEGKPGRVAFFHSSAGASALVDFLTEQFGKADRP
jgi:hypothetical protein